MPRSLRNEPTELRNFNPITTNKGNQAKAKFILAVKGVKRELAKIERTNFRGDRRAIEKRIEIVRRHIKANILTVDQKLGSQLTKQAVDLLLKKSSEKNEGTKSFKDFIEGIE